MACEKPEYRIDQQVARACRVTNEAEPDVRFGSKADIASHPPDVRFTPKSGHQ
jgi:hypothetical protein